MAWHTTITWKPGKVADADTNYPFNQQIRDNFQYLKDYRLDILATPAYPGKAIGVEYTNSTHPRWVTITGYIGGASADGMLDIYIGASSPSTKIARVGRVEAESPDQEYYTINFVVPPGYHYEAIKVGTTFELLKWTERDLGV